MTFSQRSSSYCALLLASVGLFGCASTKTQQFGMSFLPAAPKTPDPVPVAAAPEPTPEPKPALYSNAKPANLDVPAPAFSPVVDSDVQKAEEKFLSGKRLYQQGEIQAARREFDAAVDLMMQAADKSPDRQKVERRLEEMVGSIYRFDVEGLGSGETAQERPFDKAPLEEILDLTFPVDPGLKGKVHDEVAATQSQLPLTVNDTVLGFINYFNSDRGRKTIIAGLKRSGRYRPMIQRVLAEEGVPQELIYLAQAESGFLPRAVSKAAAAGMWQFVQFRGRQYGLNQTAYSDDRLDPELATRAAARHLKDLYHEFGNWHLAIAAYNCGPGCVSKAVERTGYADYWELRSRNALPRETTNYVPIILAMTIMSKNAKDYGLDQIDFEAPLEYDTVTLDAATNLTLVADLADRSTTELHELNPALSGNVAPQGYQMHVPKGSSVTVLAGLEAVPAAKRCSWRAHRVSHGETMAVIARQFNMPVSTLAAVNGGEAPEPNQFVVIPTSFREPVATSKHFRFFSRHSKTVIATRSPSRIHTFLTRRSTRKHGHSSNIG